MHCGFCSSDPSNYCLPSVRPYDLRAVGPHPLDSTRYVWNFTCLGTVRSVYAHHLLLIFTPHAAQIFDSIFENAAVAYSPHFLYSGSSSYQTNLVLSSTSTQRKYLCGSILQFMSYRAGRHQLGKWYRRV
jgi:hypothetical protein